MRDRLLKFMEAEHLQASRLAEILGVQPATISHILNGRNRPSFEFIEKLLQRFPKMNPDWLILGKGNLYRSESGRLVSVFVERFSEFEGLFCPANGCWFVGFEG